MPEPMTDAPDTHFGYRTVPLSEKQGMVDDVLPQGGAALRHHERPDVGRPAPRVEGCAGLQGAPAPGDRPFRHLDLAGGTGDVAFRVVRAGGSGTRSVVADINTDMLEVGRERARKAGLDARVEFVEANAEDLPFADASFDVATIAFGIRNVPRIPVALKEMRRVVKPGGRVLVLEFSQVDVPFLDKLYEAYSFKVIPELGRRVAGDGEPYQYLVESIRRFPAPEAFARLMREAGLSRVTHTSMTGNVVALHSGFRI